MKTIREHLQDLPEPARSQALQNMWKEYSLDKCDCLAKALFTAFNWIRSPQGYKYWKQIHDNLK